MRKSLLSFGESNPDSTYKKKFVLVRRKSVTIDLVLFISPENGGDIFL
jgi:hypothetical protein